MIIGLIGGWGIGKVSTPPLEIVRTQVQIITKTRTEYKPRVVIVKEKEVVIEREFQEKYCRGTTIGVVFGVDGNNKTTFGAQITTDVTQDVSLGLQIQNNGTYLGILGVKF